MKKYIYSLTILTLTLFTVKAQFNNPGGGTKLALSGGIGFWTPGTSYFIHADFPIGTTDLITVGGRVTYLPIDFTYFTISAFELGAVADLHWNELLGISEPWDLYSGVSANYYLLSASDGDEIITAGDEKLRICLRSGVRYFFSDQFGTLAEFALLGEYLAVAKIGITYVIP